ncbi:uncharacterized protein TNCV_3464761 [Trichonephila clavipes]|nr:uncharacterized protein TNCV_3464761 [Trichonephila clavipes]
MPSPVQSNCDAHDTIANGQYGAVWTMEHTQQGGTPHSLRKTLYQSISGNNSILELTITSLLHEGSRKWQLLYEAVIVTRGSDPCQALFSRAHYRRSHRWFAEKGILYKGNLARNPRCSRRQRIDKAEISTPVAVDQRAANCLKEAVRSFTVMWSRCRSSRADVTFRRPLPVFRVVRCLSVHCFQTRIIVELFRCT